MKNHIPCTTCDIIILMITDSNDALIVKGQGAYSDPLKLIYFFVPTEERGERFRVQGTCGNDNTTLSE